MSSMILETFSPLVEMEYGRILAGKTGIRLARAGLAIADALRRQGALGMSLREDLSILWLVERKW